MNRKKLIQQLRDKRYTYRQIGKLLGISHQRVHQILTGYKSPNSIKPSTIIKNKKYKELDIDTNNLGDFTGRDFTREAVRRRDSHTCQSCGRVWKEGQRRFDVHHIDYDKEKTRQYDKIDEVKNMITLCHKCHLNLKEHRRVMSEAQKKCQKLKWKL